MNKIPIWFDTDLGVDDAVALLSIGKLPQLELLGISDVYKRQQRVLRAGVDGNVQARQTADVSGVFKGMVQLRVARYGGDTQKLQLGELADEMCIRDSGNTGALCHLVDFHGYSLLSCALWTTRMNLHYYVTSESSENQIFFVFAAMQRFPPRVDGALFFQRATIFTAIACIQVLNPQKCQKPCVNIV